jgi:lysophospholipase L1-like esterase
MKKAFICLLLGLTVFIGYRFLVSKTPIRNTHPSGDNIICFGDSLTYGTGATEGMDYPSQLSQMISKPIINAGVPGDTTGSALARLERDVLSRSPRIVVITLGGNDLKNGVPKKTAQDNLRMIVQSVQKQGALVILGGIDIPFWGKGFGEIYRHVSEELGTVLIPNIFAGIFGNRKLMSDSIHPNGDGYRAMAQMFYEAMAPYL